MVDRIIVTVKEGKIRGSKNKSLFSGVEYYSFFGVPYGQSTAGKARFKDPVKAKPWKNILDATTEVKSGCTQYSLRQEDFSGSEDCLYNNIHTPKLPTNGEPLKPVIVNLHPGAFYHGTPETWYYGSPEYIMHHDVVYVSVAFRLHVLGFLNLGLEECSGNQAVKDTILSLQWIKDNINVFGGDPNNVTVLGSSSGSALAHCLLLSPKAKGLFHKAVLMGMYLFNPTLGTRNENKTEAYQVAYNLGYEGTDPNESKKLLAFFKKSDMEKFIFFRSEIECNKGIMALFPSSPFMPTPDQGENAVLPESLENLIRSTARIPLMVGMCDKESAMGFIRGMEKKKDIFYTSYRQNAWSWGQNVKDDDVKHITEKINSFYFNGNSVESASLSTKMDVQTDIAYSSIYETLIDVVAADLPSSVFVYKFGFEGNAFTMKDRIEKTLSEPIQGTIHAADYSYWANVKEYHGVRTATLSAKSREMVEKFTKLITTFARNGYAEARLSLFDSIVRGGPEVNNPNYEGLEVQWKPTTPEKPCYLNINDPLTLVEDKLNGERMKFWENLKKPYEHKY